MYVPLENNLSVHYNDFFLADGHSTVRTLTEKLLKRPALKASLRNAERIEKELDDARAAFEREQAAFQTKRAEYEALVSKLTSDKDFASKKQLERMRKELEEITELTRALKAGCNDKDEEKEQKEARKESLRKPN